MLVRLSGASAPGGAHRAFDVWLTCAMPGTTATFCVFVTFFCTTRSSTSRMQRSSP